MSWWWLPAADPATERPGTSRRGARNVKLTPEAVTDILRRGGRNRPGSPRHARGWSYAELARKHGVSRALVAQVVTGRAWRNDE